MKFAKKKLSLRNDDTELGRAYTEDVWGKSFRQFSEHEKLYSQAIETFQKLPDNYPVEITEGMPDIICSSCAIGKHCRGVRPSLGDGMYIDEFLNVVNNINSQEKEKKLPQPAIMMEEVYFSDGSPRDVRRVKTTAYVVRTAFKEGNSSLWVGLLKL